MCGRYAIFTPPDELAERFSAPVPDTEPTYNAAPSQRLPIVPDDREGITTASWGLIPEWADEKRDLINARAETIEEKPSFKDARRCLVPADGFYEWVDESGGTQPYYVTRRDGDPFAMAGLWTRWKPPSRQTGLAEFGDVPGDPDPIETFAIVTTEPNSLVQDLHHRMAVILPREREREWLAGKEFSLAPAEELRAYPVSRAVNSPTNDDPSLVAEATGV